MENYMRTEAQSPVVEGNIDNSKMQAQLRASYDMYETTKRESERHMRETLNPDGTKRYSDEDIRKQLELINNAQNDIIEQYAFYGGNVEDLKASRKSRFATADDIDRAVIDMIQESKQQDRVIVTAMNEPTPTSTRLEQSYIPSKDEYETGESFDVIPLPSKGEGYADKIAKVSVAYLTAYDENMILSPNLYRDNLILDYILQEKLLSKEIEPIDLLEGDREAIILFLRASGYGNEYPITVTDNLTEKEFDTVVDLSQLKYKEFNLKGDSHGWFPFTLPVSKKEVKFRFPTHRDTMILKKLQDAENGKVMREDILRYVSDMDTFIESDERTANTDKVKIRQAIRTIEKWANAAEDESTVRFNHTLTNRLNLLIMSVDGITDRKYISEFVRKMNVRDSAALRKYMTQNEPGIDYNIEVQRPESLGGGSMKTFLQLDQFLFLNISE